MHKILVVEDDPISRQLLNDFITSDNCAVYEAYNGVYALEFLEKNKVDLIVTDLVMPEMEGIEFIMKLKTNYPTIKIIAITGKGSFIETNYLTLAKELGADRTLKKPIDRDELADEIIDLLK